MSATFARYPSACATEPQITELQEGEPAPFDGDLFPVDLSIRWAIEIEGCAERAARELDHLNKVHQLELKRLRGLAASDSRADQARVKFLTAELDKARAWYRSPEFVAVTAATVAVAVLLASTVLVQATGEVGR